MPVTGTPAAVVMEAVAQRPQRLVLYVPFPWWAPEQCACISVGRKTKQNQRTE